MTIANTVTIIGSTTIMTIINIVTIIGITIIGISYYYYYTRPPSQFAKVGVVLEEGLDA